MLLGTLLDHLAKKSWNPAEPFFSLRTPGYILLLCRVERLDYLPILWLVGAPWIGIHQISSQRLGTGTTTATEYLVFALSTLSLEGWIS